MSLAAMTWAFSLNLRPATAKFVLVALADNADDEGCAFPSINLLIDKTSLDRKTVIRALDELERLQLLRDTGSRVGRTRQVKVYRLIGFGVRMNDAENGSVIGGSPAVHRSTKSSVSGIVRTVPETDTNSTVFPPNSTVFPPKGSQKRDTESSSNPQEPSGTDRLARARRSPDTARHLPTDFELTEQRREVASTERVDPDREFANFRDHWSAASGARARKRNWDAAWRIWCRKAADMQSSNRPVGRRSGGSPADEPIKLQRLKDQRQTVPWLACFRDPEPGETSESYSKAQNAEFKRWQVEKAGAPRFAANPAASKAP